MKMKILAVDDNAANLTTIEQELQDFYDVTTVLTGRRALKFLYQETVDLVLLDVEMPIMDGIETLREIRSLENGAGATLPVVFLTAIKDKATVIEGAKLGIMDYITKPFDGKELRDRITQVFMRLGKQEIPLELLLSTVNDTITAAENKRNKVVLSKLDEMQGYQTEEDIHERIRFVRLKFMDGDYETMLRMLERLQQMLEKETGKEEEKPVHLTISNAEFRSKILFIIADLENFAVHDAVDKLVDLTEHYEVLDEFQETVNRALQLLKEYDDVTAEQVLRALVKDIKDI